VSPLVFCFGSNLDRAQMARRCPRAREEASAVLPGYRLTFGGYSDRWKGGVATIEPAPGAWVHGLLYRLPVAELADLDRYEGCPFLYERVHTRMRDATGHRRRVHLYRLRHAPRATPSVDYLLTILRAYERLGFPRRDLLAAAYRSSPCTASSSTAPSWRASPITESSAARASCAVRELRLRTRS
jgi:gamma-glutamylcyclotransferase (GGCT)/AIG2-like uncharacterized protein YtfP